MRVEYYCLRYKSSDGKSRSQDINADDNDHAKRIATGILKAEGMVIMGEWEDKTDLQEDSFTRPISAYNEDGGVSFNATASLFTTHDGPG